MNDMITGNNMATTRIKSGRQWLALACLWLLSAVALAESALPAYVPRFGRSQPLIAVVAENRYTELTDYVVPYGVLSESGEAQVLALATRPGPVQLFPALQLQAQATVADFDARHPQGADYVIVPAVHYTQDPTLQNWVKAQAGKGATIVGVCDGVWVLAHAGLLDGRQAVGHWYAVDDLRQQFPRTRWLRDMRYLADGKVITTTGVTASIPVSLALVQAIAGPERAQQLAQRLGVEDWRPAHRSADFQLNRQHLLTAAGNWLAFWSHQALGIPIADGVDEISLALTADAYSRTYRSSAYALAPGQTRITSRHGLVWLPDRQQVDRSIPLPDNVPPVAALDLALQQISRWYGPPTAAFVALQLEYPQP